MASITMLQGATIDLSTLTGEYTAQNGDVLTGTSNYVIRVAADATITLNNAILNKGLFCNGDAVLVLAETNTISSPGEYNPAVNVAVNYTLTIQGEGSLTANGSSWQGAAIGAGKYVTCGNIIINNGTITTTSAHGPGIGAAYGATCGDITINGGTITVQQPSDNTAAGIGGSNASSCGNITINGGTISAIGTYYGPGIGGACGDITINGGTIDASGGYYGIGRGDMSVCGNLTIGSGITRVTASGRAGAINVGENTITIDPSLNDVTEGNTRTLTPHEEPSHIIDLATLTEDYTLQDGDTLTGTAKIYFSINIADGATVTFSDLNVTYGSKWKCFNCLGSATINIADDTQNTLANSEDYYQSAAVITNGPSGSTLTINGTTGRLTINAGRYAPAIGGNNAGARGHIVINGGVIVANAGGDAPGIGCRDHTYMGDITINGGNITAYGSNYHYGIGANDYASCGTITINGGTITASGGERGGGIGGQCAGIVINDGIITASCRSMGGPGIGGSGDLTINGGDITAVGGNFAAGIGSGYEGSCGAITIGGSITRVIATHGDYTTVAIGAGVDGTCGTITIASNLNDVTESNTRTLTPSSTPTAIDNTSISTKAVKRIVNGQLLILRGEKMYTVTGQEMK